MDDEIKNFIKVWMFAIVSLSYCYFIPLKIPKGKFRFVSLLPIFYFFTVLPLKLTTISLGGLTAFFLAWLGNFNLLLFSLGQGPLSSDPSISLQRFISLACLPIKLHQENPSSSPKENPSLKSTKSPLNPSLNVEKPLNIRKGPKSALNLAIKGIVLALLCPVYDYKQHINQNVMLVIYCCYMYMGLELVLYIVAAMAGAVLGVELEPQFDEPYLSTSIQDFWGRRWNLMVTNILRPTVYDPVRWICSRKLGLGRKWALLPAVLATFIVSGLMHELIFFYLGRAKPTWEVTWFFVLQGICVAMEIIVKKALKGRWRLHRAVSGPLAVGFVMVTGFWLFFPQLLRCNTDVRGSREVVALVEFVKDIGRALRSIGLYLAHIDVSSA